MRWPTPAVTRRSFVAAALLAALTTLGCDSGGVSVETRGGEKRRKKAEELKAKGEEARNKPGKKQTL
jgi:hypothetical protein